MKISIIVPVFNEEKTIKEIMEKINAVVLTMEKEIIVIDDGSSDGTDAILKNMKPSFNLTLLEHSRNQGKGAAIKTGLAKATGDFVIIQDADLEYDPKDYPALLAPFFEGKADIVYGSRNLMKNPSFSKMYFWGGQFLTALFNIIYGTKLTDVNTGYKVFKKGILENLNLKEKQFAFCEEVTCKVVKKGYKIKEVPIHYYPRSFKEGKKIRWWRDGFKGLFAMIRCKFF